VLQWVVNAVELDEGGHAQRYTETHRSFQADSVQLEADV
jgi:hypothetical protein